MIAAALVAATLFSAVPLPDPVLAAQRGGILLPDGSSVAIGIALETRIDGVLALRTMFSTETSGVQVFAGNGQAASDDGTTPATTGWMMPEVRITRTGVGTTIAAAPAAGVSQIRFGTVTAAPSGPALDLDGGRSVATQFGTVQALQTANGTIVQLTGPDLTVQQSIGQAIGTVVANTADNRIIDTVTSVNIDLRGMVIPSGMTSALEAVAISVATRGR
ncbi:hypothetical protein [Glacieibacterium frigidum]|uniref:Uncharacterized protein n=1 Tax=Glacieibacterium frigidum TaxID=2593303 RepID=A0A552UG78_9SPHN|nr:hypothetical protein [Glacieibacterium frigidum]TRW17233.1 hypothetical protein FMM06_03305 [Glacieibacterium frigidum]